MPSRRKKPSFENREMVSEENAIVSSSKEIVDVNNDCLERVFEHLNIFDLINVAEASVHLKVATEFGKLSTQNLRV